MHESRMAWVWSERNAQSLGDTWDVKASPGALFSRLSCAKVSISPRDIQWFDGSIKLKKKNSIDEFPGGVRARNSLRRNRSAVSKGNSTFYFWRQFPCFWGVCSPIQVLHSFGLHPCPHLERWFSVLGCREMACSKWIFIFYPGRGHSETSPSTFPLSQNPRKCVSLLPEQQLSLFSGCLCGYNLNLL